MTIDHAACLDQLIKDVEERCGPLLEPVERALRAVPRHLFIPAVARTSTDTGFNLIDRDENPGAWWDTVYQATEPIITQVDDGATDLRDGSWNRFSSSNSAPVTVADLLELLLPKQGDRVLEIGTGTGWTAALLSHMAGAKNVTTVEVDAAVSEQAAKNLAAAGVQPHLVVGDGTAGYPERAPFDRVHVTCSIYQVPYAWVEQTRPGGVIVAPLETGFGHGWAVRLVVMPDGTASGRFGAGASYMHLRSQRLTYQPEPDVEPARGTTHVNPRTIAEAPAGALLAMRGMTGLHLRVGEEDGIHRVWVLNPDKAGERAMTLWEDGLDEYPVFQIGDRPVWDEVVDAYFRWVSWGEPGQRRFGMTVTRDEGQRFWLDSPDSPLV
ncbi:methyltransferase domain-containing protein [Nonomuraea candida]|uniref:methyltransferase domain-containing protein n=1 Tax=Nonomuraea candida TaxID=359159 RepID=UPI0006941593|nr:methyltransferase domain-containing protein [Nonomuraea candida]